MPSFSSRSAALLALLLVASALLLTSCDSDDTYENEAPSAGFTYAPESPEAGTAVEFTAEATDTDGEIARYRWEFDGDGQEDASGPVAEYTFAAPGTYEVLLTVYDDAGASIAASGTVTVTEAGAPTARFAYTPEAPRAGEAVTFEAEGEDDDGQITGYGWDFDGDGQEDAGGASAEYTFPESGAYDVTLTVTDDENLSTDVSQTVSVRGALQNVVVGNGGNFGQDNGSLTLYDADAATATTTGSVGGFVTGLNVRGDAVYTLLNSGTSSGGINVTPLEALSSGVAGETFAATNAGRRIGALRDLAFTTGDRAYATDFNGGGQVVGFSFTGGGVSALEDTVALPVSFPEGIAYAGGKVFAANYGSGGAGTTLTVFEPGDAASARDVDVPCDGPRGLFVDEEGELVVVCAGRAVFGDPEAPENSNARVLFVNPQTEAVVDAITLDTRLGSINGSQAASYAPEAEAVYAISSGTEQVFRIDTDANALDGAPLDVPDTAGYTGLAAVDYDGFADRLYVARLAVGARGADYGARGQGVVLDASTGEVIDTFETGIAPTTTRVIP